MPLYEYLCEKCQQISEVMQKFSDEPLTLCPREGCGGKVSKKMSMTSFALKGSGWYTTDYKRSSSGASSGASASSETSTPKAEATSGATDKKT